MTVDSFIALFSAHQAVILEYRYVILFVATFLEGTATQIATGALIAAGIFDPVYAFVSCTIAEVLDGYLWYTVGYYFGAKPIEYFIRNSPARQAFMGAVRKHSERAAGLVVLVVKMTYSVTNATLILIGSLRYDIKRFSLFNAVGSFGWTIILLSLGYSFGHAALAYLPMFRLVGVTVFFVVCSVVALLALKHFGDTLIRRVRRSE
jgi:membrane protein DedA with SNARE-associated domain